MNSSLPPRALAQALWLMMARSRGGQHWLANAECEVTTIQIAGSTQPVTLQEPGAQQQSYVMSLRSSWIDYAKEEAIGHVSPRWNWLAGIACSAMLGPLALLLQACRLERAAIIGNHLISTNLYPEWSATDIAKSAEELMQRYPDRPLVMRNICHQVNPALADALQSTGWDLVPARMVYLCDPQQSSVWQHNHVKQDAKLLASDAFEIIRPDQITAADLPQMRALFRQIFIEKHCALNPDFTSEFFLLCQETGFLDLYAVRSQGKISGVLGLYAPNETGWLTTPLIGYDATLPQDRGLYRCLMALLLQQARERAVRLHYSSGAGQFKRARGGQPSLEYSAIFSKHLSRSQRQANSLFAQIMQTYAPGILRRAEGLL